MADLALEIPDGKPVQIHPGPLECLNLTFPCKERQGIDVFSVQCLHELPDIRVDFG